MITPFNLYKLLVGNIYPKCVNCQHYKPGIVSNGYCKMFGDILDARTKNSHLCGLEGMNFKPAKTVNQPCNKNT